MFFIGYPCGASIPGCLAILSNNSNISWTQYLTNYTATKTNVILMFGFDASSSMHIVLDDMSVVETNDTSVQLLVNPSFENWSSTPTGWNKWFTSNCSSVSGTIVNNICHSGNSYKSQCNGNSARECLVQAFSAFVNQTYTISFWAQLAKSNWPAGTAILCASIMWTLFRRSMANIIKWIHKTLAE